MEKCGNSSPAGQKSDPGYAACSACSGDYEDPDRTAAPTEDLEEVEDEAG